MRLEHRRKIHPIELIAGEDQHVLDIPVLDTTDIAANRIRRSLIPLGVLHRLLRGKNFYKSIAKTVKHIGVSNMSVQTHRHKLRQDINPPQAAIDAVGNWDIDQTIFPGQRNRRFGAIAGQWIKPGTTASTKDKRRHIVHLFDLFFPILRGSPTHP